MGKEGLRDRLFISYATEQSYIARWLTTKLTSEGFRVWCDQFELLGGESFPQDIDNAIRDHAFRVIALISRESLSKRNPTKERTLALNIGADRNEPFLIPLVVDGTRPVDLHWDIADITFIPFQDLATGYSALVKNLERAGAPKRRREGKSVAASAFVPESVLSGSSEEIYTNLFPIKQVPNTVKIFSLKNALVTDELEALQQRWAIRPLNWRQLAAFDAPPADLEMPGLDLDTTISWKDVDEIGGIPSSHLVKALLRFGCYRHALSLGLVRHPSESRLYFPRGLLRGDRLTYTDQYDHATWLLVSGMRTRAGVKYLYHLAPRFRIRDDLATGWCLQLTIHIFITDDKGIPLSRRGALSRRKEVSGDWWNDGWLKRVLAVGQFLARDGEKIVVSVGESETIEIAKAPLIMECGIGIDENRLKYTMDADKAALSYAPDEEADDSEEQTAGDRK